MKLKTYTKLAGIFACIISVTLSSCSEKSSNTGDTSTEKKASALEGIILTEAPKEVSSIAEIRKSAKPGDKVTFTGSAIGAMKIFMDNRAVMILGDPEVITACNLRPGDGCETPWDVCCDEKDDIKASIVTLRYLDSAGKVVKEGFKGLADIKELSTLVVNGTVAKGSTKDNMTVNVSGIFVKIN